MVASRLARALICAAILALAAFAAPASASDNLDVTAVPGTSWSSTAPFNQTVSFDSSAYTTTPLERDADGTANGYTNKTGCSGSDPWWGGRSGWVRFDSAVSGTLRVDAETTGYDIFLIAWDAPFAPRGSTQPINLRNLNCNAIRADTAESMQSIQVTAGRPIHIETLSFCGRAPYWTASANCNPGGSLNPDTNSPGGPTNVALSFQCTNVDGDSVCDTLDPCRTTSGAQNGCPDRDRDGFLDNSDSCPDLAGTESGCPPDQDGDSIANSADSCPTQKGYGPGGCPDGDGDGVFFPGDACPIDKGIAPNGCPDPDGDLIANLLDACPTVFGAQNGCLGILAANIRWDWRSGTFRLRRLRVQTIADATVVVRCTAPRRRGRNCPFRTKTFTSNNAARNIHALFRGRSLRRKPFALEFRVTKRGYLGTYKRYTFNGRRSPTTVSKCIDPGGKLRACPR